MRLDIHEQLRQCLDRICHVLPEFSHIKLYQVEVAASQTRSRSRAGLLAYVSPRRFKGGTPIATRQRGGYIYHFGFKPLFKESREILYFIYFLVPRFFHLSFEDKIKTLIHELYHIHPDFNGDFRRFPGYQRVHGRSLEDYNQIIEKLYVRFVAANNYYDEFEFLKKDYRGLLRQYGELNFPSLSERGPVLIKKEPISNSKSKNQTQVIDLPA